LSLERKGGSAGDHLQAGDLRQRIDDLFGEAVAEVVIVFSRTHVGERQDRNRRSSSSALPNRRHRLFYLCERDLDIPGWLKAFVAMCFKSLCNDLGELRRNIASLFGSSVRLPVQNGIENDRGCVSGEGLASRRHLVKHRAE